MDEDLIARLSVCGSELKDIARGHGDKRNSRPWRDAHLMLEAATALRAAEARVATLEGQVEEAREVVGGLAGPNWRRMDADLWPDDSKVTILDSSGNTIPDDWTVGDFRRAAAFLAKLSEDQGASRDLSPSAGSKLENVLAETLVDYMNDVAIGSFNPVNSAMRAGRQVARMLRPGYYLDRIINAQRTEEQVEVKVPGRPTNTESALAKLEGETDRG